MDISPEEIVNLIAMRRVPVGLLVLAVGWLVLTVSSRVLDELGERFTDRRLAIKKTKALLRFVLYAVLAILLPLSLLEQTGREALLPLLATLGLGLGFAFKDLIASLVAGVLLLVDEPFQVGDRISFGGYYGEVTEIGLRSVRLVTLDDNLVTIPNSRFLTDPVASANAGALDCMVVVDFYVGAAEDTDLARRILTEVAVTSPYVYLDKPVVTVVNDQFLGQRFCTVIAVKAYVFDARYEKALVTDLSLRAKRALREAGVQTPDQAYRDREVILERGGTREGLTTPHPVPPSASTSAPSTSST